MIINISIPQDFTKISEKNLVYFFWLLGKGIDDFKLSMLLLFRLTGWRPIHKKLYRENGKTYFWMKGKNKRLLFDVVTITDLRNKLLNAFRKKEIRPIKKIGLYVSCNYRMYDCSFERYFAAQNYFTAYSYTKQERFLNMFMSVVYLKPWHKFNDLKTQKRSKCFISLPKWKKDASIIWFNGFNDYLKKEYPWLYVGTGSSAPNMKKQYESLMNTLNNGDVTRNKEILRTPAHDALSTLNHIAERIEKSKPKK